MSRRLLLVTLAALAAAALVLGIVVLARRKPSRDLIDAQSIPVGDAPFAVAAADGVIWVSLAGRCTKVETVWRT